MNAHKLYPLLLTVVLFPMLALAQGTDSEEPLRIEWVESYVESMVDGSEDDIPEGSMTDLLEFSDFRKINLNTVQREELERIPFLNTFLIEGFINYRKKVGQLASVYELQFVDGFNSDIAQNLAAIAEVCPVGTEAKGYLKNELNLRGHFPFEKAIGFRKDSIGERKYPGPPTRMYLRYKGAKDDRLFWGMTAENDPGEHFFTGSNPQGFDFYSAHLFYRGKKLIREFCVGDFQVKAGQGLTVWNGFGKRKSAEATGIRMMGQGIGPYKSTDENSYFRGVGCTMRHHRWQSMLFYSNKFVDANSVEFNPDGSAKMVSSLQKTGYHRTNTEIEDENVLNVKTSGATLHYLNDRFSVGMNAFLQSYGAQYVPAQRIDNIHVFRGDWNNNISCDFLWVRNKFSIFGEGAFSRSGGRAVVAGLEALPVNRMVFNLLYRKYSAHYHSIAGNSFANNSSNSNEEGFYFAFNYFPVKRLDVSGYIDLYQTYWPKYQSMAPVRGHDSSLIFHCRVNRKLKFSVRYRNDVKSEKGSSSEAIKRDVAVTLHRLRVHGEWKAGPSFSLQSRAEWSCYVKGRQEEKGFLFFTDMLFHPVDKPYALAARLAWFRTDGYQSKIYSFERDMPQSFYIPSFYNKGARFYTQLKWNVSRNLTCYIKYGHTRYFNIDHTGSGDNQVDGNKRNEIKAQISVKF